MGRQHVVFSDGGPGPKLVVVGEAPGAEEDLQGIPFVGKSGKLLTAMLDSLGLVRRRDCVILNVLKCRPPRNRNPQLEEIVCCGHWLARQLELLKPDVLFLAGRFAISSLLKPADEMFSISKMRGRIHLAQLPDGRQVPAGGALPSPPFTNYTIPPICFDRRQPSPRLGKICCCSRRR